MDPTLHSLLQRPDIWRAKNGLKSSNSPTLETGFSGLDRALHGGWPRAALTELLLAQTGVGELRLLMPLLKSPIHHVWIDPPLLPYAPALLQQGINIDNLLIVYPADRAQWLWTCVQALRSGNAVLCWSNRHRLRYAEVRQLQVAASEYGSCGFLLRDLSQDRQLLQHSTAAPLRLQLRTQPGRLTIEVLKQRGHIAGQLISVPQPALLQAQRPLRERVVATDKKTMPRAPRTVIAAKPIEARWS